MFSFYLLLSPFYFNDFLPFNISSMYTYSMISNFSCLDMLKKTGRIVNIQKMFNLIYMQ